MKTDSKQLISANKRLPEELATPSEKRRRSKEKIISLQKEARKLEETIKVARQKWIEVTRETINEIAHVGTMDDDFLCDMSSKFYTIYFKF